MKTSMKTATAFIFLILLFSPILLQLATPTKAETQTAGPDMAWSHTYGTEFSDIATCMVATSDGGFALAGYYASAWRYMWIVKTDAEGNMLWNMTFGQPQEDNVPVSMVATPDGGILVAGTTNITSTVLVRIDANGNLIWYKRYHEGYVFSIIATSDGQYAMVGATSSATFVGTWLAKVKTSGDLEWNRTISGPGLSACDCLVETPDGGFALAGSIVNFEKQETIFWLVKTDKLGNKLWVQTYEGVGSENVNHIIETSDGGLLLIGPSSFDKTTEVYSNFWLVKTDALGNMVWDRTISDANAGYYFSAIETSDGGFALVGGTNSVDDLNCSIWLTKIDSFGNERWSQTYFPINSPADYARASDLVQTSDGSFVLIGYKGFSYFHQFDYCLVKTNPDTDLLRKNVIKISVAMTPAFSDSNIVSNFIESGKIIDTYVSVTVNENANLVRSVKLKYVIDNGTPTATTQIEEMQLQSNTLYQYRIEGWISKDQNSSELARNSSEYLMGILAKFYNQTSENLAQTLLPSGILTYSLSEIIVTDTAGLDHSFYYDLPIKSIPDSIAELSNGTYVIILSPVDVFVTDSLGRCTGSQYMWQGGVSLVYVEVVNQIPRVYFNRDAKFFYLPSSITAYNISFVGLEYGLYTLVTLAADGVEGNLQKITIPDIVGQIQSFNTKISETGEVTIQRIPPVLSPSASPTHTPIILKPKPTENQPFLNFGTDWFFAAFVVVLVVFVGAVAYRATKRSKQSKRNNATF